MVETVVTMDVGGNWMETWEKWQTDCVCTLDEDHLVILGPSTKHKKKHLDEGMKTSFGWQSLEFMPSSLCSYAVRTFVVSTLYTLIETCI